MSCNKKSYCLTTRCNGAIPEDTLSKNRHEMVAERVIFQRGHGYNVGGIKQKKAPTLTANGSYVENNLILEPISKTKSRCVTAGYSNKGTQHIIESFFSNNPNKQTFDCVVSKNDICGTNARIYHVEKGEVEIKGKYYSVKLPDGDYYFRKLSVTECARLQTMPDNYCKAVSNSQAYKALGNGWTAEVIIHILSNALKNVPKDEELVVLSMYDGIATGRYCLEKMGFTNVKYIAYEIDKYPIKIAMSNYPDIIEMGDAFQVRNDDWETKIREVLG